MTLRKNTSQSEKDRLVERAKRIYEDELRDKLHEEHAGSIIVIDGRSGDYEVGDHATSSRRLRERCPDAVTYTARIGSDYVYEIPSLTIVENQPTASDPTN